MVDSIPTDRLPDHLAGMIPREIGWKAPRFRSRHSMAVQMAARLLHMPRNWERPLEDVKELMGIWNLTGDGPLPMWELTNIVEWAYQEHHSKPRAVHVEAFSDRQTELQALSAGSQRIRGRKRRELARIALRTGGRAAALEASGVSRETLAGYLQPGYAGRVKAEDRAWAQLLAKDWGYTPELIVVKSREYHRRQGLLDVSALVQPMTLADAIKALFYGKSSELMTAQLPVQELLERPASTIRVETEDP